MKEEELQEFVENCKFTKRELIVLKKVKQVNDKLAQEEPAIMKKIVGNSQVDHKKLHDGWTKLVPKGLMGREKIKTSSKIWVTEEGEKAIKELDKLDKIVAEARK